VRKLGTDSIFPRPFDIAELLDNVDELRAFPGFLSITAAAAPALRYSPKVASLTVVFRCKLSTL
jgi:hypothetical protein